MDERNTAAERLFIGLRKKIMLPNAAVGRDYKAHVAFGVEPATAVGDPNATGLDETGLRFDPAASTVEGIPAKAGDFPVTFTASLPGESPGPARTVELQGVLTVNPDPKSLWRDIPSDPEGRFAKPDDDCRSIAEDGMLVLGASRRGRSHAHDGKYRDDDFGFVRVPTGWWLLAVADGAGSAPYSRRGSQVAIRDALAKLEELLAAEGDRQLLEAVSRLPDGDAEARSEVRRRLYEVLVRAAYAGAAAIQDVAAEHGQPERDFASTLMLAVYRRIGASHFVAGFGIGDGGIALLRLDDDQVRPLSAADSGEYAGQTRFLTTAEFASAERTIARLRFELVDRFTALVLMTDGVSDPVFEDDETFGDVARWREFWERDLAPAVDPGGDGARPEERLLRWLDFYTPNSHDDRTLAILLPARA